MNYKIFRAVNKFTGRYRLIDIFMIAISQKLRYLYAFILLVMWFRNNYHKKISLYAGISAGMTLLITIFIKLFYFKPRPFVKHRVHLLAPVPSKRDSTFPSKHTTLAFAVAISLLFYKRTLGSIMSLFACLAGFSRIWMGQHYPSDIVFSALVGSLVAICVNINSKIWNPFVIRIILTYNRAFSKN